MAIVARGLGQPESGAIVTAGLGVTEVDPNAMSATLTGTGEISGTLTAAPVLPPFENSGGASSIMVYRRVPSPMTARLTGRATVTADLTFTANFDDLDIELLLLLELV